MPIRAYHPLHLLRTKPHCCGIDPVPHAPVMLEPLKIKLFLHLHVHSHCFIATSQNLFISSSLSNTTLTLSILFHHCTVLLSIATINIWEYIFKLRSSKLLLQFSTTYILLFCGIDSLCTTRFVFIKPASRYSLQQFCTLNINGSFSAVTFCTPTYSSILQVLFF